MHRETVDACLGDQGRVSRQKSRHAELGHVYALPGRQGERLFKADRPNKLWGSDFI